MSRSSNHLWGRGRMRWICSSRCSQMWLIHGWTSQMCFFHCLHISCFPLSCDGLNLTRSTIWETKDPAQTLQFQVIFPSQGLGYLTAEKVCLWLLGFQEDLPLKMLACRLLMSWTMEKCFWLLRFKCCWLMYCFQVERRIISPSIIIFVRTFF